MEFFVRRHVRVGVVEADDGTDGAEVVFKVVDPGAAVGVGVERVACGVEDETRVEFGGVEFPDLEVTSERGSRSQEWSNKDPTELARRR